MADTSFDLFAYITAPIVTIETGIVLAKTLASAMPKSLPVHVKKAALKLLKVAEDGEVALAQRQRELGQTPDESSRDVDFAADSAWNVLHDLLEALTRLPDSYERAKKAKKLLPVLFPEGTAFLRLSYGAQVVRMDLILKRIDGDGLAKTLEAVIGPEPLQEVRAVQPRYESMVKRRLKEVGAAANLLENVRALQRAIVEYATTVASTVDSDDAASVALAREALRPIDNHRELVASGRRLEPIPPARPAEPAAPAAGPEPEDK